MPPFQRSQLQDCATAVDAFVSDVMVVEEKMASGGGTAVLPDAEAMSVAATATLVNSPRCSSHRRTVSWTDQAADMPLCSVRTLEEEDTSWRVPIRLRPALGPRQGALQRLMRPTSAAAPWPLLMVFDASALPSTDVDLVAGLGQHGVQLESVLVRAPTAFITVRVLNLSFDKDVFVRCTSDNWQTFHDHPAMFGSSVTPTSDRFFATLAASSYKAGTVLEFCLCCRIQGRQFWDNHAGANYTISIVGAS